VIKLFNKIYENFKKYIKENYKSLIIWFIIIFLFVYKVPYVVYKPGGAINLNTRVKVTDGYKTNGKLEMAYVSMVNGNIPVILLSYVIPNWDIESVKDASYDDLTIDDLNKMEKLEMQNSIDNATILAYHKANKEINVTNNICNVAYVDKKANTDLKVNDQIISINGTKTNSFEDIKNILNKLNENDKISLQVKRDGNIIGATAELYVDEDNSPKIGVILVNTYEYNETPEVTVTTKASESGPSGGLMLSLAIYNSLTENDITHGKTIIGTGTIDQDGNVGEIDGVKYKLIGAEKQKAEIFLCPKENLEEALQVKKDNNLKIEVVGVATFDDAINYLNNLN
jgi:PDZ domain-containing protein